MESSVENNAIRPFSSLWVLITASILLFLYSLCLFRIFDDKSGMAHFFLLCLIQSTPFLISFTRGTYDFISFVGLSHLFYYSIGKYNQTFLVNQVTGFSPESIDAFRELAICTATMIAFFYLFRSCSPRRSSPGTSQGKVMRLTPRQLITFTLYASIAPLLIRFLPEQVVAIIPQSVSAVVVLVLCCDIEGETRLLIFCQWAMGAVALIGFIQHGFLGMLGEYCTDLVVVCVIRQQYKRLLIPVLMVIFGCAVQSVKSDYRAAIWGTPDISYFSRVSLLATLVSARFGGDPAVLHNASASDDDDERGNDPEDATDTLLKGFARVGDDSVERVLARTPGIVPFWNGESYASLLYMFVPRAIWPNKPKRDLWYKFGELYGYLADNDTSTSISVNYFAEGYMNFGYTGMYAVAIFMGFLIAFVEWLSSRLLGRTNHFTFASLLIPFTFYADDLASVIAPVLVISFTIFLLRRPLTNFLSRGEATTLPAGGMGSDPTSDTSNAVAENGVASAASAAAA